MEELYPTGPVTHLIRQWSGLQRLRQKNKDRLATLTGRETEILALVAEGKTSGAIAAELDLSRATVQNHRASLRDKLGLAGQTDYVKYALAYGLIGF